MITNSSLSGWLGDGVTQDATAITIPKANLPGLTPLPENNGQQVIVALLALLIESTTGQLMTPEGYPLISPEGINLTYDQSAITPGRANLWKILRNEQTELIFEVALRWRV